MRRWTEAETTWFAIGGLAPELAAPAQRVLMDYQRNGDEWRRGYPADTPGLDTCWQNFTNCAWCSLTRYSTDSRALI
jgi:hypothetical protein